MAGFTINPTPARRMPITPSKGQAAPPPLAPLTPGVTSAARGVPKTAPVGPTATAASKSRQALGTKVGYEMPKTARAKVAAATSPKARPTASSKGPAGTVKGKTVIDKARKEAAAAPARRGAEHQQKLALERMLKASRKG